MANVLVLGAEAQGASSLAGAYPEHAVTFVSDAEIVDGSDLPNVRMVFASPQDRETLVTRADYVVPLSARWMEPQAAPPLSRIFAELERHLPGRMLPVFARPGQHGHWIVKGDRWHRPDLPLSGLAEQLHDVTDVHGCGVVYQPQVEALATIMVIGRRERGIQFGCIRVLDERFFWDNILQAAETIDAADVVAASLALLDALDLRGYFTLNWLRSKDGLRLSSLRPVPRAVFRMFRYGGVDLLDDSKGTKLVRAGLRMVATPTYVSFQRLRP